MKQSTKESVIECWIYDKFYRKLPTTHNFDKKYTEDLRKSALKTPFPTGINANDHEMIKAQINADYENKQWMIPPKPINEHVQKLFPQWSSWREAPVPVPAPASTTTARANPPVSNLQELPVTGNTKAKVHPFRDTGYRTRVVTEDVDTAGEENIKVEVTSDSEEQFVSWRERSKALRSKNSLFPPVDSVYENSSLAIDKMISQAPLFTAEVFDTDDDTGDSLGDNLQFSTFAQVRKSKLDLYSSELCEETWGVPLDDDEDRKAKEHLYLNTNTTWSTFICGLQGTGKSHTLSVLMENCLIPNKEVGILKRPLAALVCSYSPFTPIGSGKPCEVAYLAAPDPMSSIGEGYGSRRATKVTVLVSRSNYFNMKNVYDKIPEVTVRPLLFKASQFTAKTMLNLMSVQDDNNALYMQVVTRILREMSADNPEGFNYEKFKEILATQQFSGQQWQPLDLRLELLESFIGSESNRDPFDAASGTITIVDLTCPFVDAETACLLFSICVDLFCAAQGSASGKILALDEAHKFMTAKAASQKFAESVITNVRLYRHVGLRTIISTQDPDVHPQLLELSNFILMHRFDSPRWFEIIRKYVGFAVEQESDSRAETGSRKNQALKIFEQIMMLNPGEALLYCPRLVTTDGHRGDRQVAYLQNKLIKILVRRRLTKDGGVTRTALGNLDL
ncbi:hypothetical protein AA313_de0201735 [Arthrobotrys entomopaga]|nr:hypothetical protein AA313_de0201735 [Arthrobotrys entomopaga]